MALNSPLSQDNSPLPFMGETLLVRRPDVRLITNINGVCIDLMGQLYISNIRLTFVPNCGSDKIKSLDFPVVCLSKESFEQPIFGNCYISAICSPIKELGIKNEMRVKLELHKGGSQTFLKMFWEVMGSVAHTRDMQAGQSVFPAPVIAVANGSALKHAFVDPTDPTKLITSPTSKAVYFVPYEYPLPVYMVGLSKQNPGAYQINPSSLIKASPPVVQGIPMYAAPPMNAIYPPPVNMAQPSYIPQPMPQPYVAQAVVGPSPMVAQQVYPQPQVMY